MDTTSPVTASDRRRDLRHRTLLKAKAVFNSGHSSFEGVLRNLSTSGARIEFGGFTPLPSVFELRCDGTVQRARVTWRKQGSVGVAFL
ncbi:PilZ domain-containing protein [Prosthecomicrobium sp. N25]|uniref:PilZ domain-containing protein n=1 Tax=Prosthecomicrobium sp. N25 TaxID=3129254 RepID=UPI0030779A8C